GACAIADRIRLRRIAGHRPNSQLRRRDISNSPNCKVMTLKSGESPPSGTLATPSASLPTATAGRKGGTAGLEGTGSASVSSLPDGSKMVTDAGGGCTIYRNEERQPNPSR